MDYRGFLIAKLPEAGDRYYPWAFGIVGHGITGWAHTRREAKERIDRMLAGQCPEHDPQLCNQCAEEAYR
jgi:hypothetical protein